MAARTSVPNLRQQEQTRAAIKTTQLVKRLQWYALAETDDQGAPVDIDAGRLKAIEVLLRKSLPDLSSVTVGGDEENPIVANVNHNGSVTISETHRWLAQAAGIGVGPASGELGKD